MRGMFRPPLSSSLRSSQRTYPTTKVTLNVPRIREASLISLCLVVLNLLGHYLFGWPLATDSIAEWIMARTPNTASVWILETFGDWAKPLATTGGLATIGFFTWIALPVFRVPEFLPSRRGFLTSTLMLGGTAAVAVESYARNRRLGAQAAEPIPLFAHSSPPDTFAPGLVRKPVTSVGNFYVMSKNTVDPALDPDRWRLRVKMMGKTVREYTYRELLDMATSRRWQTLRCVSNTLKSDLMGTAEWAGVPMSQIVPYCPGPTKAGTEVAVIGVDGHGDSFTPEYACSQEPMLAVGMNGRTLNRQHGYPVRLLAPRYYGFKSVKWIGEIAVLDEPYFGTWPKMGYTKQPTIHTCSFVDRIVREGSRLRVGGVSFAGIRGIRQVQVRSVSEDSTSPWVDAKLEPPLSEYTLTRWKAEIETLRNAGFVEARALDGTGAWQRESERPLFPDGMAGRTLRRIPS